MLLTIVFILFAMVSLAALEITLFRQLAKRGDRRRSDRQALGRLGRTRGSAPDPWTVPTRAARPRSVVMPRTRRDMSRAVRAREPDRSNRDCYDTRAQPGSQRSRSRRWRRMG
jgi:hypothetical protein